MTVSPIRNTSAANAALQQQRPAVAAVASVSAATAAASVAESSEGDDNSGKGTLVTQRPGESRRDFKQRRHMVYGKRSYNKRRAGVMQLQRERDVLQQSIKTLRKDNRRLEALLVQVRLIAAKHMLES